MSMAEKVKWACTHIARGGFNLDRGVVWQTTRHNARAYPIPVGRRIAEQHGPSGFITDALYIYPDKSMLIVNRTVTRTKLAATKGESK